MQPQIRIVDFMQVSLHRCRIQNGKWQWCLYEAMDSQNVCRVHIHTTGQAISSCPSLLWSCHRQPVLQTVHQRTFLWNIQNIYFDCQETAVLIFFFEAAWFDLWGVYQSVNIIGMSDQQMKSIEGIVLLGGKVLHEKSWIDCFKQIQ